MTDKQKLIITIAQRIFDQKCFQNTSILDIVKECKMSKATFYKHFETKESFICEIINYYDEKFLEIIHSINENKDIYPSEKLKLDIHSIILSSSGFGGLLIGFTNQGNYGWTNSATYLPIILGIVSFIYGIDVAFSIAATLAFIGLIISICFIKERQTIRS